MSAAPGTKAELEAQLASLRETLDELRRDRDAWRLAHRQDAEAKAIEGCARALDAYNESQRNTSSRMTISVWPGGPPMERILRYLAGRYGVTWYDPPAPTALTEGADQ